MKAYLKDASGDVRAPLNGETKGLFFMAIVKNGEPQPESPFGNTRLLVRADVLLGLAPNVYFADFYCLRKPKDHYVTLVLARPGSDADTLCQQRLPKQNIRNKSASPFLFVESGEVRVSSKVMVELFFTEDLEVDLLLADTSKAKMKYDIRTFGAGRTTQGGLPKNDRCGTCNTKNADLYNTSPSLGHF